MKNMMTREISNFFTCVIVQPFYLLPTSFSTSLLRRENRKCTTKTFRVAGNDWGSGDTLSLPLTQRLQITQKSLILQFITITIFRAKMDIFVHFRLENSSETFLNYFETLYYFSFLLETREILGILLRIALV